MKKSEKTKQFIIEQSASLFNQKGYAGTSIQDILKATGLTKGGLYGNFESKDEIAIAAFEHAVKVVTDTIGLRTRVIDNTVDKLKTVVYFYREHLFNPPIKGGCPLLNSSIEADDNYPALREKVVVALKNWQNHLTYTINKGIRKGEIKSEIDAEAFATVFIGIIEGGIMMSRVYKDHKPFDYMSSHLLEKIEEARKK